MTESSAQTTRPRGYELRFDSLFKPSRSYVFACDSSGHVDLDALSEVARGNYFFARTAVGREFRVPRVEPVPDDKP